MGTTDPSGTVAPGFGGLVGDMFSRAWGLSQLPYQPYTGQRFAYETPEGKPGYSPLEERALGQYQGLGQYQPGQFNTGLGPVGSVQDYMNPYLQNVVDIQAREARRQSDIGAQADQAKFAQAGALGGGRDAIIRAERERNLQTQIGDIQAKGLMAAFDAAQKQRLGESTLGLESQRLGEASRQFGAGQDLRTLADQLKAGTIQRGIEQAPLDFGYNEFIESKNEPYKQLGTLQSLLEGMPIKANPYQPGVSSSASAIQGGLLGGSIYDMLFGTRR